ncbi:8-oxo-dGTP diphosphatase [Marinomonas spartinae]|uniref:8-oxo-dGTP diphosphatase n=1 Tax=Marinomonas spartinae TaxID=1792290 RepID=A0A1A8TDG8_9GAMM|nr:8-oxo-dGTP diphosphatase MutT [Marinomonas spartinae]SBS30037.1 8-oxo-dGTP diphosphatase [Marinomonas spartinae]SBS37030.1 8-oxo-dGTP diphosphatase [Marinomonas spartinae]
MLVRVAAGIILREGQVFIALRSSDKHQGGLWEFPGGKCEEGEVSLSALARELNEECGVEVLEASHFQTVAHDYGDKQVELVFFTVTKFSGEPHGREGQEVCWVPLGDLVNYAFPEANRVIVESLLK